MCNVQNPAGIDKPSTQAHYAPSTSKRLAPVPSRRPAAPADLVPRTPQAHRHACIRRRASSVRSTSTSGNGTRTPSVPTNFDWSERLQVDTKICECGGSASILMSRPASSTNAMETARAPDRTSRAQDLAQHFAKKSLLYRDPDSRRFTLRAGKRLRSWRMNASPLLSRTPTNTSADAWRPRCTARPLRHS